MRLENGKKSARLKNGLSKIVLFYNKISRYNILFFTDNALKTWSILKNVEYLILYKYELLDNRFFSIVTWKI